ncbi:MAG: phosphatidylserine decarboxylase [Planctomycetota bacterium]|nr:phosphatidylserine decarboxylase [Planctomycetota bacterium]
MTGPSTECERMQEGQPESHPGELLKFDEAYFAPWGRSDICKWSGISLLAFLGGGALSVWFGPWWYILCGLALGFGSFMVLFFRNPERAIPADAGVLVSPADGTIWDIEEIEENDYIGGRCLRIGIFLSVFNVHVNRAPCAGEIEWIKYKEGDFAVAYDAAATLSNESNSIGMRIREEGAPDVPLLLRQISGAIARRIICPLEEKDLVARGGLIGMIKYGSRTEIIVPLEAGFQPAVSVKDKVSGGLSVLGRFVPVEAEEITEG